MLKLVTAGSMKRFVSFFLVGLSGVVIHLSVLGLFFKQLYMPFWVAQLIALLIAMTTNFLLNNLVTYRDHRLHGGELLRGLISFCMACSIGTVINVLVASYIFAAGVTWMLAGFLGAIAGSFWNYITTSLFTWKMSPKTEA